VTSGAEQDLMSVLGHELRSPLTAIRGAATLLLQARSDLPPEKVAELLQVIDSQAARMADRVEDVLVAGRLDGGRQRVLIEDVELADVIADVLEAARTREPGRRIRTLGLVEGVTVRADLQRLTQVLRVLVDNAVRFSPPASSVEVRVDRKRGRARVEVRDRGPGIPSEDRTRIFERGLKLNPVGPGAGLGLYVATGLQAMMDGELGVDSRPGGGSIFWFTVPRPAK
jgi:signal transduction histidine kinase